LDWYLYDNLYDDLHAKKWDVCENLKKYEKVHW